MALIHARQGSVSVKDTSVSATVGNDAVSRASYYLSCASSFVDIPDELTRYRSSARKDKRELVRYMLKFPPSSLPFIQCEDIDWSNEFKELSVEMAETLIVGGRRALAGVVQTHGKTFKVMLYKAVWLRSNYTIPLRTLQQEGCIVM